MATMMFCAFDGKVFRGKENERMKWNKCTCMEKPTDSGGFVPCATCRFFAEGFRAHNKVPYVWVLHAQPSGKPISQKIIVAGSRIDKKQLLANRLKVGEIIANNGVKATAEGAEEKRGEPNGR